MVSLVKYLLIIHFIKKKLWKNSPTTIPNYTLFIVDFSLWTKILKSLSVHTWVNYQYIYFHVINVIWLYWKIYTIFDKTFLY